MAEFLDRLVPTEELPKRSRRMLYRPTTFREQASGREPHFRRPAKPRPNHVTADYVSRVSSVVDVRIARNGTTIVLQQRDEGVDTNVEHYDYWKIPRVMFYRNKTSLCTEAVQLE